jgi:CxxC motif-containing protein
MSNNDFLKFASREEVSASVKLDGLSLQYASDELKSDREIVLAAVAQNCYALQYASDGLRADREIVLTAVTKTADSLKYASDELKSDREIISVANGISNGLTLEITRYTEKSLRSSKPYMLVELRKKGSSLEYASDELKSDREIVLAAVTQNGYALQHESAELRANREIVLAAVKQNGGTLKYASDQLCEDKELVSLSISNGLGLEVNASTKQSLRNSKLYMMEAVRNNYGALEYASDELKSDREFILTAVKQNGGALKYASDKLKAYKQIILDALNRDSSVLTYVNWNNESISKDKDFLKEIAIRHTDKIYLIEKNIIADFDLLLSIANESKEVLTFFDALKSNQKFWYWLIQNDCTFFDVIPHTYKKSIEFIIEVYRQSPNLFWSSNLNEIISKPNM